MNPKLVIAGLLLLQGCAAVQSVHLKPGKASEEGVVYYLPKKLVKFEFERAPKSTPAEQIKATAAYTKASDAKVAAQGERNAAKRLADAATPGTSARLEAEKQLGLKEASLKLASEDLTKAEEKLSKIVGESATPDGGPKELVDSIKLTVLPAVADTSRRFSASPNHLITRSDKLDLKTSASGLLTNAVGRSDDKTADILMALSQSVSAVQARGQIQRMSENFQARTATPAAIVCPDRRKRPADFAQYPFKLEVVFDPMDGIAEPPPGERDAGGQETAPPGDGISTQANKGTSDSTKAATSNGWDRLSAYLCARGADYTFVWNPIGARLSDQGALDPGKEGAPGIFYRRALPYQLAIFKTSRTGDSGTHELLQVASLEIPNGSPPELLRYEAGAFTTTDLAAEFQDGMLTSHSINRPSEALAIVKIPYDIAKALISVPAEIFRLRVDYTNQEAALIDARTKVLKSKAALEAEEGKATVK